MMTASKKIKNPSFKPKSYWSESLSNEVLKTFNKDNKRSSYAPMSLSAPIHPLGPNLKAKKSTKNMIKENNKRLSSKQ